ncbi:MAG: hypothetical protein ABR616_00255 [Dermatophilaceae bacterium]
MLTLAGCGADDEPAVSGMPAGGTITCEHPNGYAVTYPSTWQTYANQDQAGLGDLGCSIFGTAPMAVEPETELPWVPIRVHIEDGVSFEDATRQQARMGDSFRDVESQDNSVAGQLRRRSTSGAGGVRLRGAGGRACQ